VTRRAAALLSPPRITARWPRIFSTPASPSTSFRTISAIETSSRASSTRACRIGDEARRSAGSSGPERSRSRLKRAALLPTSPTPLHHPPFFHFSTAAPRGLRARGCCRPVSFFFLPGQCHLRAARCRKVGNHALRARSSPRPFVVLWSPEVSLLRSLARIWRPGLRSLTTSRRVRRMPTIVSRK
jgi:hypothetical protein